MTKDESDWDAVQIEIDADYRISRVEPNEAKK